MKIIAPNVRDGGGVGLLTYLLEYASDRSMKIKEIHIDSSVKIEQHLSQKIVRHSNFLTKFFVYLIGKRNSLYFGNLPPITPAKGSAVYMHNPYIVMDWTELFSCSHKLIFKYLLQKLYFKYFIRNVDLVICQTESMQLKLEKLISNKKVLIIPFYDRKNKKYVKSKKSKFDLCYTSLCHAHKNHSNLFKAFKILSDKKIKINVALTIDQKGEKFLPIIDEINNEGYVQIQNFGLIDKKSIDMVYNCSRALIFPSFQETLGLPLIEAADAKLYILASDLPYVYDIVEPTIVFDPESPEKIATSIQNFLCQKNGSKLSLPKQNLSNKVDDLLNLFFCK